MSKLHLPRMLISSYVQLINLAEYFTDLNTQLYDLTEDQATEKIKQIEQKVRDALLVETTTVRTKNTGEFNE